MKYTIKILALSLAIILSSCREQTKITILQAPAGERITQIDMDGTTVIPNGRLVTPIGKSILVAPHPFGIEISNDGNMAVTANSGTNPLSITIIRNLSGEIPEVQQIPPGSSSERGVIASVFMG